MDAPQFRMLWEPNVIALLGRVCTSTCSNKKLKSTALLHSGGGHTRSTLRATSHLVPDIQHQAASKSPGDPLAHQRRGLKTFKTSENSAVESGKLPVKCL